MRWPWILAISLAVPAGIAHAKDRRTVPAKDGADFWLEVVEPHAREVRALIAKTRAAIKTADDALQTDAEWAVDARMTYFEAAYGMMRRAHELSPDNLEVLALLGRAADELGKTPQAVAAYQRAIELVGPDKAGSEITGGLGALYVRMGDRDTGIRWLRAAQGPLSPATAEPLCTLANALATRGEVPAAIQALTAAMPPQGTSYYSHELSLVAFTLAVVLDRDEQRGAAFDVLDRMRNALQQQFGAQVQNELAQTRFSPAEDQHYYLALLYEALDEYPEARAEWALYAASGASPWRDRALDHIHEIDAQRRAAPPPPKTKQPPPPQPGPLKRRGTP